MRAQRAVALLAVVVALFGASCGDDDGGRVGVTSDASLTAQIRDLAESGGGAALQDLTAFEWDEVHVFGEGSTRAEIDAAVGEPVIRGARYVDAGQLLVFARDGDVVRAVSVVPDLLAFDRSSWSSSVRLEADGAAPGLLHLVDG